MIIKRTTAEKDHEIVLPCPRCGKRLADLKGHRCIGDVQLEFKCPGSCGQVWISTQYIEKILAKNDTLR
jgi:predicted RNA-binding Zn-ribbon protein involved in translation (DUF1610 family)